MPQKKKACAFGTCEYSCIKSSARKNFLRVYPDGYPIRGSNAYVCRECKHKCTKEEMQVDHMKPDSVSLLGSC
jgi:hypothetical protein